ncbi:WD40/YVTN/BNR-like repeat-containing protein [Streptomyces collinus]|uniref:WD40/YVTN/BNR-like repeat-containing protein n=1 Tax=Streptomyces collinus TaxID=42684 RepID=UPI00378E0854
MARFIRRTAPVLLAAGLLPLPVLLAADASAAAWGLWGATIITAARKDGARLEALDIAVSPTDPGVILATTAEGVARSSDGGKTFARGKEPVMAFLSWTSKDGLHGIDTYGGLNRSTDGGTTWKKVATVPGGQPQALTAVGAEHVLAATQTGVFESKDGGKTFKKRLAVASSGGH